MHVYPHSVGIDMLFPAHQTETEPTIGVDQVQLREAPSVLQRFQRQQQSNGRAPSINDVGRDRTYSVTYASFVEAHSELLVWS